jgi:hypothetical protein
MMLMVMAICDYAACIVNMDCDLGWHNPPKQLPRYSRMASGGGGGEVRLVAYMMNVYLNLRNHYPPRQLPCRPPHGFGW